MRAPNLPVISSQSPQDVRRAIEALRVFFANSGGVPSLNELRSTGIIGGVGHGGEPLPPAGSYGAQAPHAPLGFTVTGAFATIILQWNMWGYLGHSHTEIWRAQADDLGQAVMIATTSSFIYADIPPSSSLSEIYYYWIRFVNTGGTPGPYNGLAGTTGSTADDPEYVRETLTTALNERSIELTEDMTEEVERARALASDHAEDAAEAILDSLLSSNDGLDRARAVTVSSATITAEIALRVTGTEAQYTLKFDNNGFMSGWGLASSPKNEVPFSEMYFMADRHAFINPAVNPKTVESITRSGTTATATCAAHGRGTGDYVVHTGAAQKEYNGSHKITVTGANTYTFPVTGTPATPATMQTGFAALKMSAAAMPFIVQDGKVYMDTALIKDATITSAKIQSLVADKLVAVSGTIAEALIGEADISSAMIANAAVGTLTVADEAITATRTLESPYYSTGWYSEADPPVSMYGANVTFPHSLDYIILTSISTAGQYPPTASFLVQLLVDGVPQSQYYASGSLAGAFSFWSRRCYLAAGTHYIDFLATTVWDSAPTGQRGILRVSHYIFGAAR